MLFVFYPMNRTATQNLRVAKNIWTSINRDVIKEYFSRPSIFNNLKLKLFAAQQLKTIHTIYLCTNGFSREEIFKI